MRQLEMNVDASEDAELRRLERGLPSEMGSVGAGDDDGVGQLVARNGRVVASGEVEDAEERLGGSMADSPEASAGGSGAGAAVVSGRDEIRKNCPLL